MVLLGEKEKMNARHKLILIGSFAIFQVCCIAFVFIGLSGEGAICQKNPYVYVADSFKDWDGEDIYAVCSCSPPTGTIYFDKYGIYNKNPMLESLDEMNFNFSIPK